MSTEGRKGYVLVGFLICVCHCLRGDRPEHPRPAVDARRVCGAVLSGFFPKSFDVAGGFYAKRTDCEVERFDVSGGGDLWMTFMVGELAQIRDRLFARKQGSFTAGVKVTGDWGHGRMNVVLDLGLAHGIINLSGLTNAAKEVLGAQTERIREMMSGQGSSSQGEADFSPGFPYAGRSHQERHRPNGARSAPVVLTRATTRWRSCQRVKSATMPTGYRPGDEKPQSEKSSQDHHFRCRLLDRQRRVRAMGAFPGRLTGRPRAGADGHRFVRTSQNRWPNSRPARTQRPGRLSTR